MLQEEKMKKQPFSLPEAYFDAFPERLKRRIAEEESLKATKPAPGPLVRNLRMTRSWVALAAAIAGLALLVSTLIRVLVPGESDSYPDMAMLEQLEIFDDDRFIYEMMEEGSAELDDEEAFAQQAMDYLALNDVERIMIYE